MFFSRLLSIPLMPKHSKLSELSDETTYRDTRALMSKRRQCFASLFFPMIGFLLGVSFSAVLGLTYARLPRIIEWTDTGSKQFAPTIPMKTVIFVKNDDHSEKAWNTVLPIGNGFVNISNPERFGLKPGIPSLSGVDSYSVSMFHQLHCLNMIRQKYQILQGDIPNWDIDRQEEGHSDDYHTRHCFDFLSQSILCAGDLTIEWARVESDGSRFQVDGWGIPHQCKNPEAILAWVEANHGPVNSKASHNHKASI